MTQEPLFICSSEYSIDAIMKILKPIAAAAITLICLFVLNRVFTPKYIKENTDGRITGEFYTQAKDPDVVFLGASTVHYCVSPDHMWKTSGFTSYDRSNASQTMWQSYYMLKDTLSVTRPSLVVLDVSFVRNGEEFIEEPSSRKAIDGMRDPLAKLGAAMSSKGEDEQVISYFLPVLRFHSRWKELDRDDWVYAFKRIDVTHDGYLMDFSIAKEQHIYENTEPPLPAFPEKSADYLNRIIRECADKGIPLFLMRTPSFQTGWYDEYDEMMDDLCEKEGLAYVNFTKKVEDIGIDVRRDYIDDGQHMNVVGAHKFSEYLGGYLRDNYELPFHDNDAVSDSWNRKLLAYESAVEAGMADYESAVEALDIKEDGDI